MVFKKTKKVEDAREAKKIQDLEEDYEEYEDEEESPKEVAKNKSSNNFELVSIPQTTVEAFRVKGKLLSTNQLLLSIARDVEEIKNLVKE